MGFDYKAKARAAIESGELNEAVEQLKKAVSQNPYWAEGHRLLGDIYFVKLSHYSYALVEYRKLKRVSDDFTDLDKLRLARAYHQRGFEDKAARILETVSEDDLPEKFAILEEEIEVRDWVGELKKEIEAELEDSGRKYFEKYNRQAREYMQAANFYRAEKNFKKALDYEDCARTRLDLARCQVQRVKFPEAIENLKMLRSSGECRKEAEKLLDEVYGRLGLPVQYSEKPDNDASGPRQVFKTG